MIQLSDKVRSIVTVMKRRFFLLLAAVIALASVSGCKVPPPRFKPTYEEEACYVWISENPKAYITQSYGIFGGQMEIDTEMCVIRVYRAPGSYDFHVEQNSYSVDAATGDCQKLFKNPPRVFYGRTTYKEDSIICKANKHSENFAGQKIVFTRYVKDEVTPSDFGFDIEHWDDFVTVIDAADTAGVALRTDSSGKNNRSQRKAQYVKG